MDGFQPTWRPGLHVYSHWHRAASSDLIAFLDVDVGFGSKSEVTARHVEVCFAPESGHAACILECSLCANRRYWAALGSHLQPDQRPTIHGLTLSLSHSTAA